MSDFDFSQEVLLPLYANIKFQLYDAAVKAISRGADPRGVYEKARMALSDFKRDLNEEILPIRQRFEQEAEA